MTKPLRVLLIEDSEDDALLVIRQLRKGGYDPICERVETAEALRSALGNRHWDVILCDYKMPRFNGLEALALFKERDIDIPFILVSGTIGEEIAVAAMKTGAHDYVMKDKLSRLAPAIDREMREAASRRKKRELEEANRESSKRWRNTIDAIADAICLFDTHHVIRRCNRAFCVLVGKSFQEVIGLHCWEAVHGTEGPIEGCPCDRLKQSLRREYVTTCIRDRWFDVFVDPMLDQAGNLTGIVHIMTDVTEKKRAEETLRETTERLRKTLGATVQSIAAVVETRDPYTSGHQRRVADLARSVATEMNLSCDRIDGVRIASLIHDIGKISVPAEILSKPSKLTDLEFSLIQTHSRSGYNILKDIDFPWPIARMVLEHHERMDGSGYPNGLKGDEIMPESRIMAVADVVEAIASYRPYRPARGIEAAVSEIKKNKGILYDPEVVDACLRLFADKGYRFEV